MPTQVPNIEWDIMSRIGEEQLGRNWRNERWRVTGGAHRMGEERWVLANPSERKLPVMAIIAAAMRKLLHLIYGVLKNQLPFDPEYGKQFAFNP